VNFSWALCVGFTLGLRHATDADHIAAVGTLLEREGSVGRALGVGGLWGVGHSLSLFAIGALVVLAGIRIPRRFELATECVVAAMLLVLGAWALVRQKGAAPRTIRLRPFLVGAVHGVAGSAGVVLLALTTIDSKLAALGYLSCFGIGTIAGMMLLTWIVSIPARWSLGRHPNAPSVVVVGAALLSIALGLILGARAIVEVATGASLPSNAITGGL
jgi:nickel/cobalt exporter